jgi:signal transduction histidine kinase
MKEMRKPTDAAATAGAPGPPPVGDPRLDEARLPFRTRIFGTLLLFALIPTVVVTLLWAVAVDRALTEFSAGTAWDRIARTGDGALTALRDAPLSDAQRDALAAHEAELRRSVELARRFDFVAPRAMRLVLLGALVAVLVVAAGASRVAGHLSRQLSRPLDELVGWTERIRDGVPLPAVRRRRGAPEFAVLRDRMRRMAQELEAGRQRALEAERAEAFRESARRFAHELKNPLTPIRFAVDRLRRDCPEPLRETVEVLAEESARLDAMARSFAQFGRLPEGPVAEVDVAELVTRTARHTVPEGMTLHLDVAPALPLVRGYHEPLVRAVSNVLLNAVEACGRAGRIAVAVQPCRLDGAAAVAVTVADSGPGVAPEVAARMFEPYVTSKPGGTGLGLAIARQTVEAHGGHIGAEGAPGAGTTVRIVLPVAGPPVPTPSAA